MRCFIAGATGVYGRNLLPLLHERGHEVHALVRTQAQADALNQQGVQTVLGDLLSNETQQHLPEAIHGRDAVLHLATAIPRDGAFPGAWEANTALRLQGTRALLDATLAAEAPCYLQQSIVMAYLDGGDRLLDESAPQDESNPVFSMESMVRGVPVSQLRWIVLRGGMFVGPDTAQDDLIRRIREQEATIPGDGSHYVSPIHVADMATATVMALERASAGSIFNVNAEPLRYGDYVDVLADHLGQPRPVRTPGSSTQRSCRADAGAIRRALGWATRHSVIPAEL